MKWLIFVLSFVKAQEEYDPCDCQTQDVIVGNLEMKIDYLEQLIQIREIEKLVLKKGPDVSFFSLKTQLTLYLGSNRTKRNARGTG